MWQMTPHSGGYYHTIAAYWANGALKSLAGIPGYTTITYGVDGEGRLTSAQQGSAKPVCDTSCSTASTTFDPAGHPLVVNIGGTSDNDTYTFNANTGRMHSYAFTVGATPATITGTLTWNSNATLRSLAITDSVNPGGTQTCNFGTSTVMGYDDLSRLLNVNCGALWSQAFSYDQFGNITKTGSLSWACPTCYNAKNQYNATLSANISYDADGNLLNDTFYKYTWDAFGHPSTIGPPTGTVTCGTNGTCLTYDANGNMVEKNVAGAYTEILYSPVGKTATMSGQTTVSAYLPLPAGETLLETGSTGGTKYFWHKDWLGTTRFGSALGTRASAFDRAFAPFGEMYDNFGVSNQLGFTGDTQDTIAGLFDTPNRELHPNQGRWISPDPSGMDSVDSSNPQSWNRYAYALNNPLSGVDPSGLECVWDDGSYDDDDDPDSGSPNLCAGLGGSWVDHSYFQVTGMADWSSKANANLTCAGIPVPGGPVDFGALASSNSLLNFIDMYQAWKGGGSQDFKNTSSYPDPSYGDLYNRTAIGNFNFGASLSERGWDLNRTQYWAGVGAEISNAKTQAPAILQEGAYVSRIFPTPPIFPRITTGPGSPGSPVMAPNGIATQGDQAASNENQAVVQGWLWSQLGCDR